MAWLFAFRFRSLQPRGLLAARRRRRLACRGLHRLALTILWHNGRWLSCKRHRVSKRAALDAAGLLNRSKWSPLQRETGQVLVVERRRGSVACVQRAGIGSAAVAAAGRTRRPEDMRPSIKSS